MFAVAFVAALVCEWLRVAYGVVAFEVEPRPVADPIGTTALVAPTPPGVMVAVRGEVV